MNRTTKKFSFLFFFNREIEDQIELKQPKYLQCPAVFPVSHLKKFVLHKFGIDSNQFCVEIMYKVKTIVLPDHYTLMDVAYIYTWKKVSVNKRKSIILFVSINKLATGLVILLKSRKANLKIFCFGLKKTKTQLANHGSIYMV